MLLICLTAHTTRGTLPTRLNKCATNPNLLNREPIGPGSEHLYVTTTRDAGKKFAGLNAVP